MTERFTLSSLVRDVSTLFTAEGVAAAIALFQGILVARMLSAGPFGMLAVIIAFVTIVNQVFDFRIRETCVKFCTDFYQKGEKDKTQAVTALFFAIDAVSGLLGFLIVAVSAAPVAAMLLGGKEHAGMIILYAGALLITTLEGTCLGILSVCRAFTHIGAYTVFTETAKLFSILLLMHFHRSLGTVLYGYLIASAASAVLLLILARKASLRAWEGASWKKLAAGTLQGHLKNIAGFLLQTNLAEITSLCTKHIDILILGKFRPAAEVGIYKLAKSMVASLQFISNPVHTVLYPHLTGLWVNRKYTECRTLIGTVTRSMAVIFFIAAGMLWFAAEPLARIFCGREFSAVRDPVRLMAAGTIVAGIFVWIRPMFLAWQRPGILTALNAFFAVTLILLSLWFVPKYGITASAILYTYPYLGGHAAALYIYYRLWKQKSSIA